MEQIPLGIPARRFIYLRKDLQVNGVVVRQNEVAILEQDGNPLCRVLIYRLEKTIEIPRTDFEFFDIGRVGDQYPKKVCNVCQRLLDTEEFQINQHGINNRVVRRPSCNGCREVIDGVPTNSRESREWNLRRPHLAPFKCPICEKITIPGLTSKVVLDHDHNTGHIRGWICDSCNTGIGRFKDDEGLLKRAIKYLEDLES